MKASMIACRVRSLRKRRPSTLGIMETKPGSVTGMKGSDFSTGAGNSWTFGLLPSHPRRMARTVVAIKLQAHRQIAAEQQKHAGRMHRCAGIATAFATM